MLGSGSELAKFFDESLKLMLFGRREDVQQLADAGEGICHLQVVREALCLWIIAGWFWNGIGVGRG